MTQRTDWQPIETAPRDGTMILVGRWDQGLVTIYSDYWVEDSGCWCDSSSSFLPTHWMPLPRYPEECGDGKTTVSKETIAKMIALLDLKVSMWGKPRTVYFVRGHTYVAGRSGEIEDVWACDVPFMLGEYTAALSDDDLTALEDAGAFDPTVNRHLSAVGR